MLEFLQILLTIKNQSSPFHRFQSTHSWTALEKGHGNISQLEGNKENLKHMTVSQVLLTTEVPWISVFLYCKFVHMQFLLWAVQKQFL